MEEQIEAVQRMQDYIEAHLNEHIPQADLAGVSMYSPWYSYRLFVRHVGMTPSDYIRRFRLSRSALCLRDEKVTVTDIAFKMGYGSVDGYQRDKDNPRVQLEPVGSRGYIELLPVRPL